MNLPPLNTPRRFLCVVPPTGKYVREDRCQTPIAKLKTISLRPPIDLLYCAGSIEAAGAVAKFRDYAAEECDWEEYKRDILAFEPTDVIISVTTLSLQRDLKAASIARELLTSIRAIAIGAHFNTLDLDSLTRFPELDIVIRGEYEHACHELASDAPLHTVLGVTWRHESGELIRNSDRPFEDSLDALPLPARHLARNELYTRPDTGAPQTTLVTNRGCPFHCTYCLANQVAGTKNRYRSVSSVMREISVCVNQFGITNFLFRSELFTQNKAWVIELCRAILESGLNIQWACNSRVDTISEEALTWMKRSGCWIMAFGVESGDQATLDRVQKRSKVEEAFKAVEMCRRVGIRSSIYLLIGLPWDDETSISKQIDFAKALDPDFVEVFYPYPFPGTPLRQEAVRLGLIADSEIPSGAYADPAMPTLHLSKEALIRHRSRILRAFYLRPRTILRTVRNIRSWRELASYTRAGIAQLFTHQSEALS